MRNRDLHSALKTEQVASCSGQGVDFIKVKLQWGKDDFDFSLHASPRSFTTSGFQTTDFLAYLGFQRGPCAFTISRECYGRWIKKDFELDRFCNAFSTAFTAFTEMGKAQKFLGACGYSLDQPEGWGYFAGKASQGRDSYYTASSDGHTSPKTALIEEYRG